MVMKRFSHQFKGLFVCLIIFLFSIKKIWNTLDLSTACNMPSSLCVCVFSFPPNLFTLFFSLVSSSTEAFRSKTILERGRGVMANGWKTGFWPSGGFYSNNHRGSFSATSSFYNNMIGCFRNRPEVNRFTKGLLTPFIPQY